MTRRAVVVAVALALARSRTWCKMVQLAMLRVAADHPTRQASVSEATAASVISMLDRAAPGFRRFAESDGNLFDRESIHGLFAACSHFVGERCPSPSVWPAVAQLLNRVVGGPDAGLSDAACTCFLENLASRDHPLGPLLRGEALACWQRWCDGD
ncbi:MAG: hypothetical protein KAI24_23750 [Planctomycetes bacterium]|nr:hypothetical protein [Planctomycetota bacterium]